MAKFILYWFDGKKEEVEGPTIADAMNKAGIGQGALRALDYWEKIEDDPRRFAVAIYCRNECANLVEIVESDSPRNALFKHSKWIEYQGANLEKFIQEIPQDLDKALWRLVCGEVTMGVVEIK